jgi:hypothetical protein
MNRSIIEINYDDYDNISDFLLKLEEFILIGQDSFYTVVISGNVDPLSSKNNIDWFNYFMQIEQLSRKMRVRLNPQINTRIPVKYEHREFKEIFHRYPVCINYYISNMAFDGNDTYLSVDKVIKKLETWDSKNPMKTNIIIDLDDNVSSVRLDFIKEQLNNTFIQVLVASNSNFKRSNFNENQIIQLIKN